MLLEVARFISSQVCISGLLKSHEYYYIISKTNTLLKSIVFKSNKKLDDINKLQKRTYDTLQHLPS